MRETAEAAVAAGGSPERECKVLHWLKAELDATIEEEPAGRVLSPRPVEARRPVEANTFIPPSARAPETSHGAARAAYPKSGSQRALVLEKIREAGELGATDWELEVATGWKHQSVSATRNSLMRDGWIRDSGKRRRTDTGNLAVAWVVVEA